MVETTVSLSDGILIGAVGGGIAGLTVWLAERVRESSADRRDRNRAYKWLKENTSDEDGHRYRTTRAIASWTNLPQDRVRYVCSIDKRIFLSTGPQEDKWSLYERGDRSVYENRGIQAI